MKRLNDRVVGSAMLLVTLLGVSSCGSDSELTGIGPKNDGCLCLNDIQVIGSHNSYKQAVEQPILDFIAQFDRSLAQSIEYEHITLQEQLDLGLRNLEFDVFYDPIGGHYANPQGLGVVANAGITPLPYDENNELEGPGLKMFHTQDVDFRSHHLLFKDGLSALKEWSDQHPDHLPIIVLINAKDAQIPLTSNPVPFTREGLLSIDEEISSIYPNNQLVTPDDVRGEAESLEDAILTTGWPELDDIRGKILFVLDENETKTDLYLSNFTGQAGAIMFVNKEEGNPEAAFRIVNDPINDFSKIQSLVNLGYMVRTRADSETIEARANDLTRFQRAVASGAHVISTDYYIPSALFTSDYQVIFNDDTYEQIQE